MGTEELLSIDPSELEFPCKYALPELLQIPSRGGLINELCNLKALFMIVGRYFLNYWLNGLQIRIAGYQVKTTNPKKYSVRPNNGVVLPRSTCNVIVTMQSQREAPPDMQCKDRFLIQSVVARPGVTPKDINPEMFNKEAGNHVEDCKLRVVYVSPPKPPSPVPEESEEGSPPRASESENGHLNGSELPAVSGEHVEVRDNSTEARALFLKLSEEKNNAIQQNKQLRQELSCRHRNELKLTLCSSCRFEVNHSEHTAHIAQEDSLNLALLLCYWVDLAAIELLRRGSAKGSRGIPLLYVVLIGLLGIIMGYLIKNS
ncbi:hypothetical protein C3L33_16486, partial [Rhododendron williamsianum]